jgi:2-methylisocitrate lyase-like PEP mutase family enzyme
MVIFPMSAFRVAMKATNEFFRELKEQGTQTAWLEKMQTRKELYELLNYDPVAESWPGYGAAENVERPTSNAQRLDLET